MATELDKLVVKIEADLSNLKKGMAKANKEVQSSSQKIKKSLGNINRSFDKITATTLKLGAVLGAVFAGIGIKSIITAGRNVENLQVKLKALFGSANEGKKAFKEMLEFAGKVPFSLAEIQQGAGALAIVADDAEHLAKLMEITGNVASVTGLSFADSSLQLQRSLNGGIASADMFRDAGVRNMLGFQAGATISIEETADAFDRVFLKGGRFGNASEEFAQTLDGTLSMIGDKFLTFKLAVSDEFFGELKDTMNDFNDSLQQNAKFIEALGKVLGEKLADGLADVIDNLTTVLFILKSIISLLLGGALFKALSKFLNLFKGFDAMKKPLEALNSELGQFIGKISGGVLVFKSISGEFREFKEEINLVIKEMANDREVKKAVDNYNKLMGIGTESKFVDGLVPVTEERAKKIKEMFDVEMAMIALEQEDMMKLTDIFENAGKSISDTFGKAIASGESFRQSMLDIFQSVIAQVISLIVQLTVIEPLLDNIRKAFAGGGGNAGPVDLGKKGFDLGAVAGNLLGGFFGRAGGGSVNPNMPYMVGERGAEMFVPKSAGTIVSNNQVGGAGGGNIVIEQNLNFATGVSQTVRAEVMNLLPAIQQSTLSAVQDARLRGGTFAKDFGA